MKNYSKVKSRLILKSLVAASLVMVGCSSKGSFNSSSSPVVRKKTTPAIASPGENDVNAKQKIPDPNSGANGEAVKIIKPSSGSNGEALSFPPVTKNPCAVQEKPHRVLIIDLKSGWFAGDGQEFFKDFLKINCSQSLEIVYAHLTNSMVETNFTDPNLAKNLFPCLGGVYTKQGMNTLNCTMGDIKGFDQAWLLSGSMVDAVDLHTFGIFFSSIKARFKELKSSNPKASFFFSAGVGNTDHSNHMAGELFPEMVALTPGFGGKIFENNKFTGQGTLPDKKWGISFPAGPLKPGNAVDKGTFLSGFPAFKDLSTVFDYANEPHTHNSVALGNCLTDPIVAGNVQTVMVDHCGQKVAAFGMIGTHKVYLDGNTARFYGSRSGSQLQTGQVDSSDYFLRIISSLM